MRAPISRGPAVCGRGWWGCNSRFEPLARDSPATRGPHVGPSRGQRLASSQSECSGSRPCGQHPYASARVPFSAKEAGCCGAINSVEFHSAWGARSVQRVVHRFDPGRRVNRVDECVHAEPSRQPPTFSVPKRGARCVGSCGRGLRRRALPSLQQVPSY
jgi:hypothetical protein